MPSNQEKIKNVYEAYLKINGKDKSTSTEISKKKSLSLSSRDPNSEDKPLPDVNGNQPFISSLTKIVMDQCYLPLSSNQQHLEPSEWMDILYEIKQTESR